MGEDRAIARFLLAYERVRSFPSGVVLAWVQLYRRNPKRALQVAAMAESDLGKWGVLQAVKQVIEQTRGR